MSDDARVDALMETVEPVLAAPEQLSERLKAAEAERDRLKAALREIASLTPFTIRESGVVKAPAIARAALADVGGTTEPPEGMRMSTVDGVEYSSVPCVRCRKEMVVATDALLVADRKCWPICGACLGFG